MIPTGFSEPIIAQRTIMDGSGKLSLDCSIAYLRKQPAAEPLLQKLFALVDGVIAANHIDAEAAGEFQSAYTLRFAAALSGMTPEDMDALEKTLNIIDSI